MDGPERWEPLVGRTRCRADVAAALAQRDHKVGPARDVTERLHSIGRREGRSPLFVITVMDRDGHLLGVAACDPEDYEYRS